MSDIFDGIARIRHEFLRVNLKPPAAILLSSHEEGMRMLSEARQQQQWVAVAGSPDLGHLIEMADGSVWMEIKIMDIAVRWPAKRFAMPDGSWRFT